MTETLNSYSLELEGETACLYGVIAEHDSDGPLQHGGMPELRERLKTEGYESLYFPTDALSLFLKKLDKGAPGRYLLAERRDASIAIEIARDKKTVSLKYSPAMGGKVLQSDDVIRQILDKGVAEPTIQKSLIDQTLEKNRETNIVVARAVNPVNGKDATFKALVKSQTAKDHDLDSLQAIDMHDLFEFTTVAIDQALMKKTPPTKGEDGMDVCGKVLSAKPGKDAKFDRKHEGAKLSEDGLTLLAEIEGYPIIGGKSVKVDPVLSVKAVDLNTGHIDFNGTLFVQKEIESRYDICVTGDVIVGGSVVRTNIKAGGNLSVKGGIHAESKNEECGCEIQVGGNLSARFLNQVKAQCGGEVNVDEYILQSEVTAKGDIKVGETKGKGAIIGGHLQSQTMVISKTLGSDAFIKTHIALSRDEKADLAVKKLDVVLRRRRQEERQIESILSKVESAEKPKMGTVEFDKVEKVSATLSLLREKIAELEEVRTNFSANSFSYEIQSVNARKNIFPNVQVLVNGHLWHCEHSLGPSTVRYHDDLVVAGDFIEPPPQEQPKE
jgi:uncharacterized protein (DUF342 family)